MQTVHQSARDIPVADNADVLVVGGGPSGLAAAAAAARKGADVVLLERYGCLGGLATGGLVLLMDAVFDNSGERLVGGLFWELMLQLREVEGLAEETPVRLHVDSEILKVVADRLCVASGVRLRFHSWAGEAIVQDGAVSGVTYQSKSGHKAILSKITVDATGDGDIAANAGAPFETANQRIGLNYKIGGVNQGQFREYRDQNGEELAQLVADLRRRGGFPVSLGTTPHSQAGVFWVNVLGLGDRDRNTAGPSPVVGSPDDDPGQKVVEHFSGNLSAVDENDLTFAEVELREQILATLNFYRTHVPGFESVRLLAFASQIGVRDSRRVTGLHRLTRQDVLGNAQFGDCVGRAALPFGSRQGFDIPYGCLVPPTINGLLVAGRCISTDSWVQQTTRLIPPAIATGQAAGTAAALCAGSGVQPRDHGPDAIRKSLLDQGVIL